MKKKRIIFEKDINNKEFNEQDKDIIKANVKLYIQALLNQEGINV